MKNWLLLLIPFYLLGKITGWVREKKTDKPIPFANLMVLNTPYGTATNEKGFFCLLNIPPGIYSIEASAIGYQSMVVKDVIVEREKVVRLNFILEEMPIELEKITVTAERPLIAKEWTRPTYILKAKEMTFASDYFTGLLAFQPGVIRAESLLHIRGGRAEEVDYRLDGVSIIDPLLGELGIDISKGILEEVIFFPGGFGSEYGKAMSGVINLISLYPSNKITQNVFFKTERFTPKTNDYGYANYQTTTFLPIGRFQNIFSFDLSLTDDADPRFYKLPHKERQDYCLYGKTGYQWLGKANFVLSSAFSHSQFNRYHPQWKFNLNNYRSDLKKGQVIIFKSDILFGERDLWEITASRFFTEKKYGVKKGNMSWWRDIEFKELAEYEIPKMTMDNPFGVGVVKYLYFYTRGDYQELRHTSSLTYSLNYKFSSQISPIHQVFLGGENNFYYVKSDWISFPSWYPSRDTYTFKPSHFGLWLEDKIDYRGLFANIGLRFDRFLPAAERQPKAQWSPRLSASHRITDWLFFRWNYGYYFQIPNLSYFYDQVKNKEIRYRQNPPPLIGNPDLKPERTTAYEIGLQGEVSKNLLGTFNLWYKDVKDLVGTRIVLALPHPYTTYTNIDYARLKGLEIIWEIKGKNFSPKLAYSLSYAQGTSSYANENYYEYIIRGDTNIPLAEYSLDFDQRHRLFFQLDFSSFISGRLIAYLGQGFPYTPPGGRGDRQTMNTLRRPWRKSADLYLYKEFSLYGQDFNLVGELLNILGIRDILYVYPATGKPDDDGVWIDYREFRSVVFLGDPVYHSARDLNHDGLINPNENYLAVVAYHQVTVDWINNYGPGRRVRLGVEIKLR